MYTHIICVNLGLVNANARASTRIHIVYLKNKTCTLDFIGKRANVLLLLLLIALTAKGFYLLLRLCGDHVEFNRQSTF